MWYPHLLQLYLALNGVLLYFLMQESWRSNSQEPKNSQNREILRCHHIQNELMQGTQRTLSVFILPFSYTCVLYGYMLIPHLCWKMTLVFWVSLDSSSFVLKQGLSAKELLLQACCKWVFGIQISILTLASQALQLLNQLFTRYLSGKHFKH